MRYFLSGLVGMAVGIMLGLLIAGLSAPARYDESEQRAAAAEAHAANLESQLASSKRDIAPAPPSGASERSVGGFQWNIEENLAFLPDVTEKTIKALIADASQAPYWKPVAIESEHSTTAGLFLALERPQPSDRSWVAICDRGRLFVVVDSFHERVYNVDLNWFEDSPDEVNARKLATLIDRAISPIGSSDEADAIAAAFCGSLRIPAPGPALGEFRPLYRAKNDRVEVQLLREKTFANEGAPARMRVTIRFRRAPD